MTNRPLIGISMDECRSSDYSKYPISVLRNHYFKAVYESGGIPVGLYNDNQHISKGVTSNLVSQLQGIIISGGGSDVPPTFYGQKKQHERIKPNLKRSTFEYDLCKQVLAQHKPLLGICGGMQLINVVLGGTLIQHIVEGLVLHEQPNPPHETSHTIEIMRATPLWTLNQGNVHARVNSAHHQGIDTLGKDLKKMAWAEDHILEAFYHVNQKFCCGFQWHPEFLITDLDRAIYTSFIKACTH